MNLLSVLLNAMLTDNALAALSKRTGLSVRQLRVLIPIAVPLLLRFLTKNASSQSGANSLLGALKQHTSTKTLDQQFDQADVEDGSKIVRHILGDDTDRAIESLALETNLSTQQVEKALDGLAPALLSVLSAVVSQQLAQPAQQGAAVNLSDGLDLSEMLTLFAGAAASQQQQQQSQPGGGLLNLLLGGTAQPVQPVQQPTQPQGGSLLQALLGLGGGLQPAQPAQPVQPVQPVQQSGGSLMGSLLGTLLGAPGAQPAQQTVQPIQQQNVNSLNGNTLVNLLLSALR